MLRRALQQSAVPLHYPKTPRRIPIVRVIVVPVGATHVIVVVRKRAATQGISRSLHQTACKSCLI